MSSTESDVVAEIRQLFISRGDSLYGGESVTQLEHALQAAYLAEQEGAAQTTIAAALLHDIGHLLHDLEDDAPDKGVDDAHEQLADEWLADKFPAEVTEPIRLHVAAKRYLCQVDADYLNGLSEPSKLSLQLQGGPYTETEARDFEKHQLVEQVVQVRRYDDLAKVVDLQTPDLEHFLQYVSECVVCAEEAESV
ncbi:MAG: phosphonate degradation HD-domain oxygenase [Planctomycetota bacterium]